MGVYTVLFTSQLLSTRGYDHTYDYGPIGKILSSGRLSQLRSLRKEEDTRTMPVERDDAAQADRMVMEYLLTHGATTMETLVRALVSLSWAQVFSAVDRLSRANKVHLGRTAHRDYTIRMRDPFIPRHVLTQVISVKDRSHHVPEAPTR